MIGLAVAAFFGFGALLVLFGANATELVQALAIDDERLGLVGSMLSLGLGVGILVAGPLVDVAPRRPLFLAACGVVVLATTTIGPETSFASLLVHTALIGFGAGFYETLLNAVVVERAGPQAARRLIFIHSAATLGAAVTPVAIGAMRLELGIAWFESFRIAGLLHVAIALLSFTTSMQRHSAADPAHPSSPTEGPIPAPGVDGPKLVAVCLAAFAYVGSEAAVTLFVARYTRLGLGLDALRGDAAISAFWTGLLVGRLSAGLSPRALGAGSIAVLASVASLVVVAFGSGWLPEPEIAMAVTGFGLGGAFPILIALAGTTLPGRAGTAVGLAAGIGSLGGFVVPWITGRIATIAGLSTAFLSLAFWIALLAATSALVRLRPSRSSIP